MNDMEDEATLVSQILAQEVPPKESAPYQPLDDLLRAFRRHLGMDVAFISEFARGRRVFKHVDAANGNAPIEVGNSDPLEESYCQMVVDGRLPELIFDAAAIPAARAMPVTAALPVGAHISVPIYLSDGTVYGTLCCFSFHPDRSLNERDLSILRMFAEVTSKHIERDRNERRHHDEMLSRIEGALAIGDPAIVYQPICDLRSQDIVGFEGLARFSIPPVRTPDVWFSEAAKVGKLVELEQSAISKALGALDYFNKTTYISVNVSPETIIRGGIAAICENKPLHRILLEITEHAIVSAYAEIATALQPLRNRGLRLAVDDAGAGYASFRHILALQPDVIKLDMSLTRDIDTDWARRALASALVEFAKSTQSEIVAEGVETASELRMLRKLGICKAQGYVLGRPLPYGEMGGQFQAARRVGPYGSLQT